MTKANALRLRLAELTGQEPAFESQRQLLDTRVQDAEVRARLAQLRAKVVQVQGTLQSLNALSLTSDSPPQVLKRALEQLAVKVGELETYQTLLDATITVIRQKRQMASRREVTDEVSRKNTVEEDRILQALTRSVEQAAADLASSLQAAAVKRAAIQKAYDESFRRGLLVKRTLPRDILGWKALLQELVLLPLNLLQQSWQAIDSTARALRERSATQWANFTVSVFALLGAGAWTRVWLRRAIRNAGAREPSFSTDLLLVAFQLLRDNMPTLLVLGLLAVGLWQLQVPDRARGIAAWLALIWGGLKLANHLAWLLLNAPRVPATQRQPALYRQLSVVLLVGGVLATLTVFGHQLELSTAVTDVIDRAFLLFILLVTWPTLGIRRLVLDIIQRRFGESHWLRVARIFTLLIPFSMLAAATVGLLGYLNLAWAVSEHLIWLLVVLILWLIVRGVLRDAIRALKNFANLRSSYGLLWAQGIIDPVHRVLRVVLFLVAIATLFRLYGWGTDSTVVRWLRAILEAHLFSIGSAAVTPKSILLVSLSLLIIVYVGRWTREITYRWIYSGVADLGIRNSFSVFSQYAVVVLGLLIALRTIGIDLTALAIFAGALGIGVGLGLQRVFT